MAQAAQRAGQPEARGYLAQAAVYRPTISAELQNVIAQLGVHIQRQ